MSHIFYYSPILQKSGLKFLTLLKFLVVLYWKFSHEVTIKLKNLVIFTYKSPW